jgi:transcriptional activator SPT7
VLHALHENGQMQPQDLETHIKDEIEREGVKIAELSRKVRQAYKETVSGPGARR